MDLFSKIIKRPLSITGMGNNEVSSPTAALEKTDGPILVNHGETTRLSLTELLDSAAQDINQLEEHHKNLIALPPLPPPKSAITSRDSIQQLLSSINVNLNQVSEHEMEHLQAMSEELSPLAVKANPKPIMDQPQQKIVAAAAALRSSDPLQLGDPSTVSLAPIGGSGLTFAGLPEFDETEIPELAPLSADMLAVHLKSEAAAAAAADMSSFNSTHDYNSDSDVFVECSSLNSNKRLSNDPAELEAYTSALNEVLEDQGDAKLNNTLSVGAGNPNCSYEPMDVDELNETMEILKDVMAPEDHQLLREQLMSDVVEKAKEILNSDPFEEVNPTVMVVPEDHQLLNEVIVKEEILDKNEVVVDTLDIKINVQELKLEKKQPEDSNESEKQPLDKNPIQLDQEETPSEESLTEKNIQLDIPEQSLELESLEFKENDPLLTEEQYNEKQESLLNTNQQDKKEQQTIEQKEEENGKELNEDKPTASVPIEGDLHEIVEQLEKVESKGAPPKVYIPDSPPIPTHRPKTAEELEFLALKELVDNNESQLNIIEPKVIPIAFVTPTRLPNSSTTTLLAAPISPTFPVKDPPEPPSHFPHSPHAPSEEDEMPYLEKAVIEPSSEDKSLGGVIAKLPVTINVIQASPEKKEMEHLNETLPMEAMTSPLTGFNGDATFDSKKGNDMNASPSMEATAAPLEKAATFSVPLKDANLQGRCTFTINTSFEEQQQTRRTFTLEEPQQIKDFPSNVLSLEKPCEIKSSSKTFFLEEPKEDKSRRTFTVEQQLEEQFYASPAQEATEEDDFEPMDVDISIGVADTTVSKPAPSSPPIPTHQKKLSLEPTQPSVSLRSSSPPIPTHQTQEFKRPPIHFGNGNATMIFDEQTLSAKEQATLSASDEKDDVFMEHFGAISPVSDDMFKTPQYTTNSFNNLAKLKFNTEVEASTGSTRANIVSGGTTKLPTREQFSDAEFEDGGSNNNIILNSSDFDYLYTKGNNNEPVDRSSLLLKFDPLLGAAVPVNSRPQQQEQAQSNIFGGNSNNNRVLSPTLEEHETSGSNQSFAVDPSAKLIAKELEFKPPVDRTKKHAKMSVDVIDNDCNKTFDNSNLNTEDKANNYHNMDELEKKIKNEVTRSEDIEKKLKDAEQREEALIKRITEKDKTNSKLNGVIEAYEKAIAELISEKEQLVQNYERQLQEVQADRDSNYHHLTSLETTFSDLHVKYEKSKEMTSHLRQVEETLLAEKKQTAENLQLQEQRYEKMKSHAMQQLEIANKKLDSSTKEHADEVKKLKALLKKEEVSRVSTAEQLQQKSRENADLLKICEELIYGKGQGGSS